MIDQIKSILEEVRGVPGLSQNLSDSASLIDDVGLDSLEMLTFMLSGPLLVGGVLVVTFAFGVLIVLRRPRKASNTQTE